ncbi:hypothetical protein WMY93_001177 [Mugilogobius chulae]|uniref:Uncharacterized protein n=1 Tax=Mugilogobius chulae TaxID=88201 RepID=A0AAW0Q7A7_9GOBI
MKSIFPGDRSGLVRLSIHYTSVLAGIYVTPRGFGRNRTAVDSIWCNRHLARNSHMSRPTPASQSVYIQHWGQLSYQDPAFGNNKLDGDAMFLGMPESLDFGSTNQFRVPQPPMTKGTPPNNGSQNWRREGNMADSHRLPWSYPVGDDDYNIPPLTPPTLPEHMMPQHLPHETPPGPGQYHPLDPPSGSGPHHPYQLQGLEMSRMSSGQDGRTYSPEGGPMTSTLSVMQQMVNSDSRFTSSQQPIEAALGPGAGGSTQPPAVPGLSPLSPATLRLTSLSKPHTHSLPPTPHISILAAGYPPSLQSEYQSMGGGMLSGAPVMSSSVDYHQLGRHTPGHHPSLDWSTDYHGNGALQRDKPLFLS